MALQAEEMYEELGFDEAEGAAEGFEEEEGFEEMEAAEEFEEDAFEEGEEFEEFEEGEEFEEFEEGEGFEELAVANPRAIPMGAGLAARTVVGRRGPMMSPTARRAAVRTVTRAAQTLVARGGPRAIRALPRIARTVRRTAAARGTPAAARPQ